MKQVLALKNRPKQFRDLVGQDTISSTLSLALDTKRLSHAYLFSGLRGSGKTSTARIMAKSLVCNDGPTSTPCDKCDNCISANENKHLDIIEMDAASNRGIDDIKDLIEHTKYKPTSARYKIFIIDEVHMLTHQAFNALLKTLEEPPEFIKFILATTDPLKLPATILSRTQHFRFKKIANKNIIHHLSHILNLENINFEDKALDILARSGQGSLRDALTLLDQAIIFSKGSINVSSVTDMLGLIEPDFMSQLFDTLLRKKDILHFVEQLDKFDTEQVIDEMIIFLKYKMLAKDPKFDTFLFDRFFRILANAKQLLNINSDSVFVLTLSMLKMMEATNLQTIDEAIVKIKNIEVEDTKNDIQEDTAQTLYSKVIAKIYDKSYNLGECFEKSFSFNLYKNNTLYINSMAQGECRKQLLHYIDFIKQCTRDIYGKDTNIKFNKIETKTNDILNSNMVQKATELFQPSTPPIITN